MTEADWLNSTDPQALIAVLRDSGKLSERKARLFAAACCRQVWHLLTDEEGGKEEVEVAEQYADAEADAHTMSEANLSAWAFHIGYAFAGIDFSRVGQDDKEWGTRQQVGRAASEAVLAAAWWGSDEDWRLGGDGRKVGDPAWAVSTALYYRAEPGVSVTGDRWQHPVLCQLLRDVFGNPFAASPRIDLSWLVWNDGTVRRLAEAIYDVRSLPDGHLDNTRLAILADALEDAGCDNVDILNHCRLPGVHVRGCWLLDL